MQQFPDEFEILTELASPQSGSQPGDRIDQEGEQQHGFPNLPY